MSMAMPPSLIGLPVAFLPVPRPQTLFFADAVPEPTICLFEPVAHAVIDRATTLPTITAIPTLCFFGLILFLLLSLLQGLNTGSAKTRFAYNTGLNTSVALSV